MKKRSKHKKPIGRLVLAFLLASVLVGAGGYAYYKRNLAKGITLSESIAQMKDWISLHKQQLHAEIKKSKKVMVETDDTPKPVKFEFYDSLADSKVEIDTSDSKGSPVIPIKTARQRSADDVAGTNVKTVVVSHDELVKEMSEHVQAVQDDKVPS